ncbi:MAG: sulfite exporter TauE/SafE family protein [Pseudomonadales bacterium]|nr:sulfite exporter TauE/SafE family protein [Halioglobus sp.]MCP5128183.1 sulfite exporter TauE/SafE family protein [Pseudomonadales bacterium]
MNEFDLWQAGLLAAVGIVAGFLNVMAGGGSLLTVPVLVFMGLPGPVANGTNRIAILAQNLSAITAFFRRGFSDFRLSVTLAACAVPGALLGALIGTELDGAWFNRILALVMLGVMLIMHFDKGSRERVADYQPSRSQLIKGHLLMVAVGFWGGFIQIGVGFIIMPVLNRTMGLDLVRTNMHKVFIIAIYTSVALAVFASRVEILWLVGLSLALGNAIGGYLGAHFAVSSGEKLIRLVLNLVLIAFIIKLLFAP